MLESAREDLDNLVRLVGNVMDAFTSAFFLYEEDTDTLKLFSSFSLSSNVSKGTSLKSGQGLIGWVARERKPLFVKDFGHDTKTLGLYSSHEDVKAFVAVPVIHGERLIGVLCVDSKRQYQFTPKDEKIMRDFAASFGRVTVRFEHAHWLKGNAAGIEYLNEIAGELALAENIAELVRILFRDTGKLIHFSKLLFAVKSREEGSFFVIPEPSPDDTDIAKISESLDHSLMGWVIKKNRPLNHPDISERVEKYGNESMADSYEGQRSFLGVPMVVGGQVVGAIGLLSIEKNAFTNREMRVLSILCAIAASHVAGMYASGSGIFSKKLDVLTGIGNYNYVQEKVATLGNAKGALLALDICNFSRITEDYSVGIADSTLVELVKFLKRIVGKEGFVARYFGDVFLIFLYGHNADESGIAARKLVELVKTKNFFIDDKQVVIECRVGIALYPEDGATGSDLIKNSFSALKKVREVENGVAVGFFKERKEQFSKWK